VALPPPDVLDRTVGLPPRPALPASSSGVVDVVGREAWEPIESEPPRLAAIQRSDEDPTRYVADHRISRIGAMDATYLANFPNWQDYIRRWSHTLHLVRFVGSIVADTLSRCDLIVQYLGDNGDWGDIDQAWTVNLFSHYESERHTTQELLRLHAWYYETVGDMYQVLRDGPNGVEWMLYSANAVRFNRDSAIVLDLPNGSIRAGTAFAVPRQQIRRFWTPDEEWQGWATSPMAAVVNDLHLYESLIRYYRNTADSAVAMNGVLWIPGEAVRQMAGGSGDEPDMSVGPSASKGAVSGSILRDYYEAAARRLSNTDSIASVAPFVMHWNNEWKTPEYVKIGQGLDPNGIQYLQEARGNFARGVNIPAMLVEGGGTADGNHWTAWLVQEDYFKTIAPIEDRICRDLTRTFLWYVLRMLGVTDFKRFRVWYDPAPVIVRPDQGANAIALSKMGVLSFEKLLEVFGFDQSDLMPPDEITKLLKILSAGHPAPGAGTGPAGALPVGPGNVVKGPPALPVGGPTAPAQGAVTVNVNGQPVPLASAITAATRAARPPVANRAERALRAVFRSRRDAGREIRAAAEATFRDALRRADIKVLNRASTRAIGNEAKTAAAAAIERLRNDPGYLGPERALRPHLARVGIREDELFRDAFGPTFTQQITEILRRQSAATRSALDSAGFDEVDTGSDDSRIDAAAGFLAAALLALAIGRAADGHPLMPDRGEASGIVPASFARSTLALADGTAGQIPADSPDQLPDVVFIPDNDLTNRIAEAVGNDPETDGEPDVSYTWNWGFYGDPLTPFEPHEELGAAEFTTTDIESDPGLANGEGWPDGDFYQPGDHDGCSCEWVPTIQARYAQEPSVTNEPGRSIPGLGANPEAVAQAIYPVVTTAEQRAADLAAGV
jgi:hypothetical protein